MSVNKTLQTRRGAVRLPTFMPDGTRGVVKSLSAEQVAATGVQVVLANTYHLHLQPGEEVVNKLGGLHGFGKWQGPILTDSGGFQVFSLGSHRKITEEGVTFKDPVTGDTRLITPEKSIQIQLELGADMIVAFDHLTGLDEKERGRTLEAFERTHRWLERCIAEFKRLTAHMDDPRPSHLDAAGDLSLSNGPSRTKGYGEGSSRRGKSPAAPKPSGSAASSAGGQADGVRGPSEQKPILFGVVQGGLDKDLRRRSLEIVQASDVGGIAIGGLSVGETKEEMYEILEFLAPLYDDSGRPRFLLGVGDPPDVRFAIEHGIDMLDCVLPTRNARHATVWTHKPCTCGAKPGKAGLAAASRPAPAVSPLRSSLTVPDVRLAGGTQGNDEIRLACKTCGGAGFVDEKIHLTNAQYIEDPNPIDESCDCYACINGYSRGFLRHQFKIGEPLAGSLASIHNLRYLTRICESYR